MRTKTKIISAKKKKKYYDLLGNEIPTNDTAMMNDIARDGTVISYHEDIIQKITKINS